MKVEYKRWVKRTLELDPDTIGIPGNPHIYHSKRTQAEYKMVCFLSPANLSFTHLQRKYNVQSANPNGYTKLYFNIWQVQQAQSQDAPPPPPEGGEEEYLHNTWQSVNGELMRII